MPKFSTNGKCPTGYTLEAHEDELCNCVSRQSKAPTKKGLNREPGKDLYQEWTDNQW